MTRNARGWHNLARLQPGVSIQQAQAAVALLDAQFAKAYPGTSTGIHHRVVPLSQCPWSAAPILGPTLALLLAVSLGVLLIVAANVANLLLARAISRQKEIAIRLAAGASRARLIRQLLIESVLLALLGSALGVFFSSWAVDSLPLFLPALPVGRTELRFPLDGVTLGLALLLTLCTGLAFGLFPALQASRSDLYSVLKEGGRSSRSGMSHHRLRNTLVIAEVALALVLLIGAGLCIKGLQQARRINIGFKPDHVLIGNLQIGMNGYNPEEGKAFYRQVRERLAFAPGVEEAALASWFPLGLSGCKGWDAEVDGYRPPDGEDTTYEFAIVSPRYFATLRIPLIAGRDFTDADDAAAAPVAIVNEHFARRFWPGQDPIGRRFRSGGVWRTIVGVARAGKYNRLDEGPWCFFYLPYLQGVPDLDLSLCIRTRGDPIAFASVLRQAVREIDPRVELLQTQTLAAYSGMVLFPQRIASSLLMLLGAVALVLAAMGVYAVMAYAVNQRRHEFGVRSALGAGARDIFRLVIGRGLALAVAGVAAGLALAFALTRLLSGFLYGVSPFDPLIFAGVPAVLTLVVLLACYFPARRATRVDPMIALRAE